MDDRGGLRTHLSWAVLRQLLRYAIVGLLTNAAGYLVYLALTWLWLDPKIAVSLLYPMGVLMGYFGHARYSFAYEGATGRGLTRYLAAHAIGYTLNVALLYVLSDRLGYPHQAVQALAIFLVAGVLFILFRFFVFPRAPRMTASS